MINIAEIAAALAILVSLGTLILSVRKQGSETRLIDAQTYGELVDNQERLQRQVIDLSAELSRMRDEYEAEIKLLRRRINRYAQQMKDAGIEPAKDV